MDEIIIKAVQQGGPVTLVIAIIAAVVIRYLIPLADRALAAHRADLAQIMEQSKVTHTETVGAFTNALDRIERQNERLFTTVTERLATELTGVRKDLDRVSDTLDGLRADLTGRAKVGG